MDNYKLGDRVIAWQKYVLHRSWAHHEWKVEQLPEPITGFVMGKRTLYNGKIEGSGQYDDPRYFVPTAILRAFLVAYDIRKKPIYTPMVERVNNGKSKRRTRS